MAGHDAVVHFAAETHVDRSIVEPGRLRPHQLRRHQRAVRRRPTGRRRRFVHISTDEVYGSIDVGSFGEDDRLMPSSPYSASKAGIRSDRARVPHARTACRCVVTRSSNNFGPHQFPEKVIPLFVTNLLDGEGARCTATV